MDADVVGEGCGMRPNTNPEHEFSGRFVDVGDIGTRPVHLKVIQDVVYLDIILPQLEERVFSWDFKLLGLWVCLRA